MQGEPTQTPPQGDPAPVTPPTPVVPPTPAPAGDPPTGEPTDLEGLKKALASERANAAASLRDAKAKTKALEEAQAKLKEREDAEKTEAEKLREHVAAVEAKNAQLVADAQARSVRYAVSSAARDLSFINPDHAYKLLDLSDVTFDEAGEPKGVTEAVKKLAADSPYLLGSTSNGKSGPPATEKTSRQAGESTPEEERARAASFAAHTQRNF